MIITGPKLGDPENDARIFEDENGRSLKIGRGGGIPVIADAITSVKISDSLVGIANYAEQFLGENKVK